MGRLAEKLAAKGAAFERAYLGSLASSQAMSGQFDKYCQTLTTFEFIEAKINHPNFGLSALLEDYALVEDPEVSHQDHHLQKVKALQLIQGALLLSAHILTEDKTQLPGQLLGRLGYFKNPEIQAILEEAKQQQASPWLRPLTPSLTLPGGRLIRTFTGHTNSVNAVAVTPDGKRVISGSDDHNIKVWNLKTGALEFNLTGHKDSVNSVAVTPDGQRVISGSDDETLKVWNLETRGLEYTLTGHSDAVNAVAVTPDGNRVISGSDDNTIKVWNLETRAEEFTLIGHTESVNAVAVTPDGKRVISGSSDNTIKVWNLETGAEEFTLTGHTESVNAVAVTPDGKRVISCSWDGTIKVWNLENRRQLFSLTDNSISTRLTIIAVTPDGRRVISGSFANSRVICGSVANLIDNHIKVWNLETGVEEFNFMGHSRLVKAIAVTPDGKRLISGSDYGTIKVWNLEKSIGIFGFTNHLISRKPILTINQHKSAINAVAVTPDGKRVISGSSDSTLKVWNLETGRLEFNLALADHKGLLDARFLTTDGKRVISVSWDTIKVWNIENRRGLFGFTNNLISRKPILTLKLHKSVVNAAAITPDGKRVVSDSSDDTLKVWNLETGVEEFTLTNREPWVTTVTVTPDGKRVISGSFGKRVISGSFDMISFSGDKTLKVWNLETGAEEFTLTGHRDSVNSVAVTPDGKKVISGSSDKTLKVWNLETGAEEFTLKGHSSTVRAVVVTPDGKRIISVSDDNTLKIWDLSTGKIIASFTVESALTCCAVAPDGVTIVAGDELGRLHFLRLEGIKQEELI